MANALPQAIGAQFLDRGRQVVSMSGDGGFSMLMGDFLTLVQYDLPVKVVLFNNSSLGMVELEMLVAGLPAVRHRPTSNPDFAAVARACGAYGVRVEKPKDAAGRAARTPSRHKGPALVDVVTDPNALSIPPKITGEQVSGFALSASKIGARRRGGPDGADGPLQPAQHPAPLTHRARTGRAAADEPTALRPARPSSPGFAVIVMAGVPVTCVTGHGQKSVSSLVCGIGRDFPLTSGRIWA